MPIDFFFFKRGEGKETEKERNIDAREKHQLAASHTHRNWGNKPKIQACALTGNWTHDLLVYGTTLQLTKPHQLGHVFKRLLLSLASFTHFLVHEFF